MKAAHFDMLNAKIILKVLGQLLFLEAILLASCLAVGVVYHENDWLTFGVPIIVAVVAGMMLRYWGRGAANALSRRDGYLIVSLTWLAFSCVGMLPFLVSGAETRVASAFFETMSGFTTTGASALPDIDALPHSLLFWRSLMHWVGGVGIVFFTVAILPNTNLGEQKIFSAETTGLKISKLHPRLRTTAHWIGGLYVLLTLVCAVSLYLGGMGVFDAVNHAFSTLSTGGFSTHQDSIGWFHSSRIECVLMLFMFLGGVNFTLLYLFIIKRRWRDVWRNEELRWYMGILLFVALAGFLVLTLLDGRPAAESLRVAAFHTISVQTTTGFTTEDFMLWNPSVWMFVVFVTVVGGCAGSTSGGVKCVRLLAIFKVTVGEFRRLLHPRAVFPVRISNTPIDNNVVRTIFVFCACFVALVFLGSVALMTMGLTMMDAVSSCLTMLSNVGPGLGYNVGPLACWGELPDAALWVCSFLMLVGRLEIFAILLPFVPGFWKNR